MKKFWVTGIMCALAVSVAGCGDTGAADGEGSLNKEPIGQAQSNTAESTASENKEEAKVQESTSENAGESKQESSMMHLRRVTTRLSTEEPETEQHVSIQRVLLRPESLIQ